MLSHLRIRDLIVVEEATLELGPGLNVLSGSTGAGKSVLLAALALVTGARARSEWLRPGADRAIVEAFFSLEPAQVESLAEAGFDCSGGELHLKRTLRADGRGQAWTDGFPVTIKRLKELGRMLLERQDQHAQLRLADPVQQMQLLDDHAGHTDLLAEQAEQFDKLSLLRKEEESLARRLADIRRDEEYLRFQLEEIEALAPKPGERDELSLREKRLRNATRLQELYREGLEILEDGPRSLALGLEDLTRILDRSERLGESFEDPDLPELAERLAQLGNIFRDRSENLSLEAREGETLADRLGRLTALERKHARPLEEILDWAREQRELLEHLADQEHLLAEQGRIRLEEEKELASRAEALSNSRGIAAAQLGSAWQDRLALLGMERATLRLELSRQEDPSGWVELDGKRIQVGRLGIDRVAILVCTNPDLAEGSLTDLPSGGELSRIAFARHLLEDGGDDALTLVLDEVDAGIGADLAGVLAGQLRILSDRRQVLAVTHQAVVAAAADRQFCVRKEYRDERTRTIVLPLDGEERLVELSRMLGESGGDGEAESRALAATMLARTASD